MGHTTESREVLIAELLGDFVKVLDRIDAVMPTLEAVCQRLEHATGKLAGGLEPFEKRIIAMACERQDTAVAHITCVFQAIADGVLV